MTFQQLAQMSMIAPPRTSTHTTDPPYAADCAALKSFPMDPKEAKTIADFLISDFENEMKTTLRVIQAVPATRLDYCPDAKSKTGLGLVATWRSKTNGC